VSGPEGTVEEIRVSDPTLRGVARVALIFGNLWWMYRGLRVVDHRVPPRAPSLRSRA